MANLRKLHKTNKAFEFFKNEIEHKEESWVNNQLNSLFQMLGNVQEESKQIEDVLQADYRKEELNYLYENQGNVELAIQNYELK